MPIAKAVASPQRKVELLALSKIGAGTPTLTGLCASFCSIVKNATGVYTITVNQQAPFAQIVHGVAMPHAPGVIHLDLAGTSKLVFKVKCFAVDGTTASDLNFELLLVGCHASDLLG